MRRADRMGGMDVYALLDTAFFLLIHPRFPIFDCF